MPRQLDGVRVLDLRRVLAGPLAGQMLADLGAEVIKVERPGSGDESRQYGPPFIQPESDPGTLESAIYLCANRNKKSITVDFTKPEGQEVIRQLASVSDVIIENFRVGALSKYGLDYEAIRKVNPKVIYCSLTGYGQTGPKRFRPGYDAIFQAEGGLMQSTGYPDDHPQGGAMRVGLSIVDIITSLYVDIGILGALYGRDARGGTGERIDIALLDSCIAAMSHHAMHYLISGQVPPRRGNTGSGGGVPSGLFDCADGSLMITIGNDVQFKRLCEILECPQFADDIRFATAPARVENREAIIHIVGECFSKKSTAYFLERLLSADLAAGEVKDMSAVFQDEQVRARGIKVDVPHGSGKSLPLVANPIRYGTNPIEEFKAPPSLGEHTSQVLRDLLKIDDSRIAELRSKGIV